MGHSHSASAYNSSVHYRRWLSHINARIDMLCYRTTFVFNPALALG